MAERLVEFHLEAPDGIDWKQLKIFYDSVGIGRDIERTADEYPEIEFVETWHDEIPGDKVVKFKRALPNFGIKGRVIRKDEVETHHFYQKAA